MKVLLRLNQKSLRRGLTALAEDVTNSCVSITKDTLVVDTGRMAASTRRSEIFLESGRLNSKITVGGRELRGIYRETEFERFVDYAVFQEVRNPRLRNQAIPTIQAEAAAGTLLDYKLQRQELA